MTSRDLCLLFVRNCFICNKNVLNAYFGGHSFAHIQITLVESLAVLDACARCMTGDMLDRLTETVQGVHVGNKSYFLCGTFTIAKFS